MMHDESGSAIRRCKPRSKAGQRRREKRDVHGWIVLDKPVGMTSTHAVAVIKRLFTAKRAGHAGTLDPLASGCLPIALGEATKTVPFVMDGRKRYRFTVRWGEERDTDDAEGRVVATSSASARPPTRSARCCRASPARSRRCRRTSPPSRSTASAPMISRATARRWSSTPRPVDIHRLDLVETPDADHARFRGRMRQGHLCAGAGPRYRARARLPRPCGGAAAHRGRPVRRRTIAGGTGRLCRRGCRRGHAAPPLLPVETALDAPGLAVSRADAARLERGQAVLLRGRDAPISGLVAVSRRAS